MPHWVVQTFVTGHLNFYTNEALLCRTHNMWGETRHTQTHRHIDKSQSISG